MKKDVKSRGFAIGKMDWIVTMDSLLCQKKEKKEINEKNDIFNG